MTAEAQKKPEVYNLIYKGYFGDTEMLKFYEEQLNSIPSESKVIFWISSLGGGVDNGLQLMDKLKAKKLKVTYVYNLFNASMGATFPLLDNEGIKLSYHNSSFMFHGAYFSSEGDKKAVQSALRWGSLASDYIDETVRENVGLTKAEYKEFSTYDNYFYGKELLHKGEHGFLDGLIVEELNDFKFVIQTRDGKKEIDLQIHSKEDIKNLPVIKEEGIK